MTMEELLGEGGSASNGQQGQLQNSMTLVINTELKSGEAPKSEAKEEEKKETVKIGMVCGKKDLYQKIDKNNKTSWTNKYPEDLEEAAENDETEKYALLIRNKKSDDSRKKLDIDSIIIQSPLLKKALGQILKDYPGVTINLSRLIFTAPFAPFVHRWDTLTAALEGDYDEDTKTHLALLRDVLYDELRDVIAATEDFVKNRVVTYDLIWTIFQPGSIIYSSRYGRPVALRLSEARFVQHPKLGHCFRIISDRVDWDGSHFGYDSSQQFILPFVGTTPISELECYPLVYHSDPELVATSLVIRGRLFESLAGYHYKAYKGSAIAQTRCGPTLISIQGRIVVDASAHKTANRNMALSLKSSNQTRLPMPAIARAADYGSDAGSDVDDSDAEYDHHDELNDHEGDAVLARQKKRAPLTPDQLLLCTPIIRGYALKDKKWLEFFVDSVGEISFDENAFDSLVLPQGHKSLILSFAQSQRKNKDTFDDVISGKGRGVILLLSGGPGIGKTLTAESVAENMRVPLYTMSASDLGSASWQIEANLTQVLEMVAKWNAVLLLDECDVFLSARDTHDLDRNQIVSIFLRTLEYYEGILFLTTNRVRDMDEAFFSRIHLSLEYPALDEMARMSVWKGFLDHSQRRGEQQHGTSISGHELSEGQVARLAKIDLNGRVIKNILKMGNLLASHEGKRLNFDHLRTVLKASGHTIAEQ